MAYVDTNGTNRAPAVIGVAAIHAALAVVVVTGLAGGVAKIITEDRILGIPIARPTPTPPPPPPEPTIEDEAKNQTKIVIPDPPFKLDRPDNQVDSTEDQQDYSQPDATATGNAGLGDGLANNGGKIKDPPKRFDPVAPKARNGNWVTDNDYRTSWINRKWEGTVAFRLSIGADGKIKDCTITESTGHSALDEATCTLVKRRAKFEPAKNDRGDTVSGTFSSAVRWQIPD